MARCLLAAIVVSSLVSLQGCGGSGSESQTAIDRVFIKIREGMLTGAPNLDASLFETTPTKDDSSNPTAYPSDASRSLTIGGPANDGTAGLQVTVATKFTPNVDGTGTLVNSVVEQGTGFKFLEYTATPTKPTITYRIPKYGLSALKADGTGQAFILVSIKATGAVTRTFNNTSTSGKSLVNFGSNPVPSGTASGTGGGTNQFLIEMKLAKINNALVARIGKQVAGYSTQIRFGRTGGPASSDGTIDFSKLTIGGVNPQANDFLLPVGNDVPGVVGVAATSNVDLMLTVGGGTAGAPMGGELDGPFAEQRTQFSQPTFTLAGPLVGLDKINDGVVQIDAAITAQVFASEVVPQLEHSISQDDLGITDLAGAAYLGSFNAVSRSVVLLR